MLRKKIEFNSTMHGLQQQLGMLMKDFTTILGHGLGPILWGIRDLV
jgi:hypothetical protein